MVDAEVPPEKLQSPKDTASKLLECVGTNPLYYMAQTPI
jgi:hypothetical protein